MITTIEIQNTNGSSVTDWHLEGLDSIKGENIIFMRSDTIEEMVRVANPAVATVQVTKQFPQTLDLMIRFQKPVGYFSYSSSRFFILSADSTVLQYSYERPENLGEIRYYQSVSPGEYVLGRPMGSRDIRFAAQIGALFVKYDMPQYVITVQDSHLIIAQVGDMVIKSASDGDTHRQIVSLDQLLRLIRKGGERVKSIDIRFEKIIIEK